MWIKLWQGGALKKHVEGSHEIEYEVYKLCFYGIAKTILADAWDDKVSTSSGKKVITHVFVRRYLGDPGIRGATRSARIQK